jgi:hypothetical protein
MTTPLTQFIQHLEVADPISKGSLAVFPVFNRGEEGPDYTLASEAIPAGLVAVEEKGAVGSVPVLVLINKSETHILVTDGDSFVGGQQNRIVNITMLVGPKSVTELPVSCVEAGRWDRLGRRFRPGEKAPAEMREALNLDVLDSLRKEGSRRSDQARVWRDVERELASAGAESSTRELHAAYARKKAHFAGFEIPYPEGASGLIAAVGGKIAFAEVFARPASCRRSWDGIVRSLAITATDSGDARTPSAKTASRFLESATHARVEEFPSPAVGTDVKLTDGTLDGTALVADDAVVHLALFSKD